MITFDDQVALDGSTKCDFDVMKVNFKVALGFSTISVERIEELKQQVPYEERTWMQTQGKLQVAKVECILCDVKVAKCEEMYANFVKGFKISQELLTQLVE